MNKIALSISVGSWTTIASPSVSRKIRSSKAVPIGRALQARQLRCEVNQRATRRATSLRELQWFEGSEQAVLEREERDG